MDFAERLSLWFNAFDAIRLQGALQAVRAIEAAAPGEPARAGRLGEDFQRVRAALAHAIGQEVLLLEPGYAAYRQRHLELQRQMELMVGPLRDHVRQGVSRVSAELRQLAALDAAMEQMLAAREQALLPAAAALLARRFAVLRRAHEDTCAATGEPDDPAAARRPGGWLARFEEEWRQALLAEADLRLEPVAGLIEALRNETNQLQ